MFYFQAILGGDREALLRVRALAQVNLVPFVRIRATGAEIEAFAATARDKPGIRISVRG